MLSIDVELRWGKRRFRIRITFRKVTCPTGPGGQLTLSIGSPDFY